MAMVDDKPDVTGETLLAGADTAAAANAATAATVASTASDYSRVELGPAGYQLGPVLGRGGMGEVITAQDQRVGREVAYKRMRSGDATADALSRFMREARIQARLDHPAIVPVYEMGKDTEGRPYFTMKRLVGKTLAERLQNTAEPLQPLLRAFAEVCLAIELAHSKGIVHRDLKPLNIMLGDFGEVYVLDWGVARVMTDEARQPSGADPRGDLDSIGEATSGGTLLGTLGYMAPEQVRGEQVDGKADVYALGSILFEILTGDPLHPRGHSAVASTLSMETESPAKRRPDRSIPPELDALCTHMLHAKPDARPTVREVAKRVQKYLDGDRDLEARRDLAKTYLATARAELASGDPQRRADALRGAGRALALDPHSKDAADLVAGLVIEPPKDIPAALAEKLEQQEADSVRARAHRAAVGYVSLLGIAVLLPLFQIRGWGWLIALCVGIAALIGLSYRTAHTGRPNVPGVLIGTAIMAILISRAAGPYALVPVLLCGTMLSISNIPFLNERPLFFYSWCVFCATLPAILEWVGLLGQTVSVTGDAVLVRSAILAPTGWIAVPALAVANAVFLLIVARFALLVARDRSSVQRKLTIQAWHLGQLLPDTPQVVGAPMATRVPKRVRGV